MFQNKTTTVAFLCSGAPRTHTHTHARAHARLSPCHQCHPAPRRQRHSPQQPQAQQLAQVPAPQPAVVQLAAPAQQQTRRRHWRRWIQLSVVLGARSQHQHQHQQPQRQRPRLARCSCWCHGWVSLPWVRGHCFRTRRRRRVPHAVVLPRVAASARSTSAPAADNKRQTRRKDECEPVSAEAHNSATPNRVARVRGCYSRSAAARSPTAHP